METKTLSERLEIYLARRMPQFPEDNAQAVTVARLAEVLGAYPFDELKRCRNAAGKPLYGTVDIIDNIERQFRDGKIPMYAYKSGKGRPAGARNVLPAEAEVRRIRREVMAIVSDIQGDLPELAERLINAVR